MTRGLLLIIGVTLLSACTPSAIAEDYSRYSGCPKNKVEVTLPESENVFVMGYLASGCGDSANYICRGEVCESAKVTVARRFAKQFACNPDLVTVEPMAGESWKADGCGHAMTFQCIADARDNTISPLMRCMAESEMKSQQE